MKKISFFLILLSIGYFVIERYLHMKETAMIEEKLSKDFINNTLSLKSLFENINGTVCSLTPYSGEINSKNPKCKKFNEYLTSNNIRNGESEWGILVYNNTSDSIKYYTISRRVGTFQEENEYSSCVPIENGYFYKGKCLDKEYKNCAIFIGAEN